MSPEPRVLKAMPGPIILLGLFHSTVECAFIWFREDSVEHGSLVDKKMQYR